VPKDMLKTANKTHHNHTSNDTTMGAKLQLINDYIRCSINDLEFPTLEVLTAI